MRNLKRLLTMVMAIAMLMSLMVVGAGATSFGDDKDITHKDAVEKMASLNVINGRDNGNFDPNGLVTRAEMAKMICVTLSGGNDPKLSSNTVVSFTDTKNHWAAGYIEYCVNMGIAAGLGNNTFGPDQKVTPTQAAKMLLVALGYDPAYEKFTGATWALATNRIAQGSKGLYDEIQGIDPNSPMTRDAAAQMIHNFCDAKTVKYEFGISGGTGGAVTGVKQAYDTKDTVLTLHFKLQTKEGYLTKISYDDKKKEYSYSVNEKPDITSDLVDTFKSTVDFTNMYGLQVEVLFRDKDNNGGYNTGDSVYDINMNDSAVIASGVMDDFGKFDDSAKTLKFAGKVYDLKSKDVPAIGAFDFDDLGNLGKNGSNGTVTKAGAAYDVKLIDNDDDDKIDLIVCTPFTVQKVTYLGSDTATFVGQAGATSESSKDNDDYNAYNGIAKDDYVAYYKAENTAQGKDTVVKMALKTGKVTGVKGTGTKTEALIDGTWYSLAAGMTVIPKGGDTLDYIAVGNVMFYAKISERGASSKNLLTVVNAMWDTSGMTAVMKAKVMLPDDTKKEVTIAKVDSKKLVGNSDIDAAYAEKTLTKGALYTFKVNSDGDYELERLVDDVNGNLAGYDKFDKSTGYKVTGKKVGSYELADTARVIIVNPDLNDAKVYTGKEVKNGFSTDFGAVSYSLASKIDNFNYTTVATIVKFGKTDDDKLPEFSGGSKFAYLTDGAYTSDDYRYFPVWTGTEETTLKEKDTDDIAGFVEGQIITYDTAADGLVKNVALSSAHGLKTAAITAWDGTKKIQFSNGDSKEIDKADTTILYIDSKDTEGVKDGSIQEAAKDASGNWIANAYYVGTGTTLDLLVVDMKAKIPSEDMNPALPTTFTATPANADTETELNALFAKTKETLKIDGDLTLADNQTITIPDTKNLVVSGKLIIPATTTVEIKNTDRLTVGGSTFEVNGTLKVTNDYAPAKVPTVAGNLTVGGTLTAASDITGAGTVTAAAIAAGDYTNIKTTNVKVTANATTTVAENIGTNNWTFESGLNLGKDLAVGGNTTVKGDVAVAADATLTVTGTLTAATVATTGTGDVDGSGTITAASYSDYSKVSTANIVITGAVDATKTLLAKNYTFKGDVTAALTFDAGSIVTFQKEVDVNTVMPAASSAAAVAGAKVIFAVAPTAGVITASANTGDGYFVNTAPTLLVNANEITTSATYMLKLNADGDTAGKCGWVKQ